MESSITETETGWITAGTIFAFLAIRRTGRILNRDPDRLDSRGCPSPGISGPLKSESIGKRFDSVLLRPKRRPPTRTTKLRVDSSASSPQSTFLETVNGLLCTNEFLLPALLLVCRFAVRRLLGLVRRLATRRLACARTVTGRFFASRRERDESHESDCTECPSYDFAGAESLLHCRRSDRSPRCLDHR